MSTRNQIKNNDAISETKLSANLYYALMIATFSLLFIGIIMILSASTTVSYKQFDNQYVIFLRQLMFAGIGIILMLAISFLPKIFFHKWAKVGLWISILLLILVLIPGI